MLKSDHTALNHEKGVKQTDLSQKLTTHPNKKITRIGANTSICLKLIVNWLRKINPIESYSKSSVVATAKSRAELRRYQIPLENLFDPVGYIATS